MFLFHRLADAEPRASFYSHSGSVERVRCSVRVASDREKCDRVRVCARSTFRSVRERRANARHTDARWRDSQPYGAATHARAQRHAHSHIERPLEHEARRRVERASSSARGTSERERKKMRKTKAAESSHLRFVSSSSSSSSFPFFFFNISRFAELTNLQLCFRNSKRSHMRGDNELRA